jgi:Cellulase (glycosyl hydrolase family 5)
VTGWFLLLLVRKLILATVILVVLIVSAGLFLVLTSISQTKEQAKAIPVCCGVGEDYELAWTYQKIPSNLTQAWINYYSNPTFQSFKVKFGWNVIRLGFKFSSSASSSADQFLNVSDFTNLDLAISIASQNGFKVILDDIDYQIGFYGSPTWYYDWNVTAEHYKGDASIAFFEVANEMESNNNGINNNGCGTLGTQAIVCLDQVTDNIRSIDPTRAVSWWEYSLANHKLVVPASNELRSNSYLDIHSADYVNSTLCGSVTQFEQELKTALTFQSGSDMPIILGELNMQVSNCEPVGSSMIQYLVTQKIPWIAWGYSAYSSEWVPILNAVNVTKSSSSSTASFS